MVHHGPPGTRSHRRPHAADGDGSRNRRLETQIGPRAVTGFHPHAPVACGALPLSEADVPGRQGARVVEFHNALAVHKCFDRASGSEADRKGDPAVRRYVARDLPEQAEVALVPADDHALASAVDRDLVAEEVIGARACAVHG